MKKILITGNLGYIGSCLTKILLEHDYKVIGYDNCSGRTTDTAFEFFKNPNFKFIKADILDKVKLGQAKNECDMVIHLAALVGEPICSKYPDFTWLVNRDGIRNLIDVGEEKPIIFASTGSVYGKVEGVCTEESPTNPLSIYAKAKLEAEELLKKTKDFLIYRFATAYGLSPSLRLDLLPNDFTYQAWKNKCLVVFQADFRRTFCHVLDICSALLYGIESFDKLKNNVYNIGNTEGNWSKRQLAEFLKQKTGCAVFYGNEGYKDIDLRDYETSYNKINEAGWKAIISMEDGVNELLKAMPLVHIDSRYSQRV